MFQVHLYFYVTIVPRLFFNIPFHLALQKARQNDIIHNVSYIRRFSEYMAMYIRSVIKWHYNMCKSLVDVQIYWYLYGHVSILHFTGAHGFIWFIYFFFREKKKNYMEIKYRTNLQFRWINVEHVEKFETHPTYKIGSGKFD